MINENSYWDAVRKYTLNKTPISLEIIEWAKNWPDKIIHLSNTLQSRFLDCEHLIIDSLMQGNLNIETVCSYCNNTLKGRWTELEDSLFSNPSDHHQEMMVKYSILVIKNRWKECEKFIINPKSIWEYSRLVIRGRWEEKEHLILTNPVSIYNYSFHIGCRWKEGEKILLETDYPNKDATLCNYAKYLIKDRWKEAEKYIKDSPSRAYSYALEVVKGRWEEGESAIAKDSKWAFSYAQNVLKGAFPLAEPNLLSSDLYFDYFTFATHTTRDLVQKLSNQFDPDMTVSEILQKVNDGRNRDFEYKLLNSTYNQKKAVWYAANVLNGRWIEAEDVIKKSPKWSVVYARDVVKGRWEDAEKHIAKDPKYLAQYGIEVIKDQLPIILHNSLLAEKLKGNNSKFIKNYFDMLSEND